MLSADCAGSLTGSVRYSKVTMFQIIPPAHEKRFWRIFRRLLMPSTIFFRPDLFGVCRRCCVQRGGGFPGQSSGAGLAGRSARHCILSGHSVSADLSRYLRALHGAAPSASIATGFVLLEAEIVTTSPNERSGVDAGTALRLYFQCLRSGATHHER